MDGQGALRDGEADRIDQERHVVVHHLDDGVGRGVAVLLERRVEHAHQRAPAAALRELEVRQRGPREHRGRARRHVVRIDVGVIGLQEALGVHAPPGLGAARGVDDGRDRLAVLLGARLIHVGTFENQHTREVRAHAQDSRCGRENGAPVGMRDYARARSPALQMPPNPHITHDGSRRDTVAFAFRSDGSPRARIRIADGRPDRARSEGRRPIPRA